MPFLPYPTKNDHHEYIQTWYASTNKRQMMEKYLMDLESVKTIIDDAILFYNEQKYVINCNNKVVLNFASDIVDMFKKIGIEHRKKYRGRFTSENITEITKLIGVVQEHNPSSRYSPSDRITFYYVRKDKTEHKVEVCFQTYTKDKTRFDQDILRAIAWVQKEDEVNSKLDEEYAEALRYLVSKGVTDTGIITDKSIAIHEYAKRKHDEEVAIQYPEGVEIDIDDNICECARWVVGERRCSCGTRRVYLHTEKWGNTFSTYPCAD